MRTFFGAVLISLALAQGASAQDQQTMNREAHQGFVRADSQLNGVYKQLAARLSAPEKSKLAKAQQAWIKFRDAHAEARAEENAGGSIYPMILEGTKRRLTEQRTAELKSWLDEMSQK